MGLLLCIQCQAASAQRGALGLGLRRVDVARLRQLHVSAAGCGQVVAFGYLVVEQPQLAACASAALG
jgi:hypothetical protein